ncbi:MAG: hypothetical protein ACTSPI_17290 [Candidatus Heimdallarchaeaceae archaeon]
MTGRSIKRKLKKLKKLSEEFDINVEFAVDVGFEGKVDLYRDIVHLNYDLLYCTDNTLFSTFFHEYAHILNKRNEKYYHYHNVHEITLITTEILRKFTRTQIRAERYTDKVAKVLMSQHLPKLSYIAAYDDQDAIDYIKDSMCGLTVSDLQAIIADLKANPANI